MNDGGGGMTVQQPATTMLGLAELLAALSLATDLGMNNPPGEAMRACLLAAGLARKMNLSEPLVHDIYYTALLKYVGCTAYAHEEAALGGGDDIGVRAGGARVDDTDPRQMMSLMYEMAGDMPRFRRVGMVAGAMYRGVRMGTELPRSHCEVATSIARRLNLPIGVEQALYQSFERWDGKGAPQKLRGDDIALPARFAQLATRAIIFHTSSGIGAAQDIVRSWSGGMLDPSICAAFSEYGPQLLEEIDASDPWNLVAEVEPEPRLLIPESRVDDVATVFGDMADLKMTFTLGHSPGVARLARAAACELQLSSSEGAEIYRAGLVHDLGRVSVPNGIWEKPGPLTSADWEQVRLHAYHSERILARSPVLAPVAQLAGMHHERLDGSGYHRQSTIQSIPIEARILAAADAYQAMTADRPHRAALSEEAAALELGLEVECGRLDADAVRGVLTAAGHTVPQTQRSWPAGLSDREVEVLRLIARGMTARDVGRDLFISPKTAGHHIQHIYTKIGVSTRAAAAMFAMEHNLLTQAEK
jgi:HD-GYP domain-containing protein (c-di-GMP phosphodiesterase class II)/DNA-binding CsgD family transcriptional regulator